MKEVIPYYKPLGLTPLQAIDKLKAERPELQGQPITYTGRLDPMAEGLLLLLVGEAVHEKDKYLGLDKTYEAKVLFGFSTDSYDVLGLVASAQEPAKSTANKSIQDVSEDDITVILRELTGEISLPLPPFSSPPVNGKPLWQWAREGRLNEIDIPQRVSTIHSIVLDKLETQPWTDVYEQIKNAIGKVDGDFRQKEILASWARVSEEILSSNAQQSFQVVNLIVRCGSGTYIRSLADELGRMAGTGAVLLSLKRTRVGKYKN